MTSNDLQCEIDFHLQCEIDFHLQCEIDYNVKWFYLNKI